MSAARSPDAATERVEINLLRHLEWQAGGFSLVFLFADVGPSLQMAAWLDERMTQQGRPLQRQDASEQFVHAPEAAVDALVGSLPALSSQSGACWYAVQRHPSDSAWNTARRLFLARLNERRFLLERDLRVPLLLVLPADFRPEARNIAPDIWHVRALSEELRTPLPLSRGAEIRRDPGSGDVAIASDDLPASAELERTQILKQGDQVFLSTAWRAVDELLAAGQLPRAYDAAQGAVRLARQRAGASAAVGSSRDLSTSLKTLAKVARAVGAIPQAEAAYREALDIARQLAHQSGDPPEASGELASILDDIGLLAIDLGDLARADAAYRESLALRQRMNAPSLRSPASELALAGAFANVGRVAGLRGHWEAAQALLEAGLDLRRGAAGESAATPQALRDLSIALDELGDVARARADWALAGAAYAESLDIGRQLAKVRGDTPETLRDLAVSLNNLGYVASAQGDLPQATQLYNENLAISRALVEQQNGAPQASRDLSVALENAGGVAAAQGDWDAARRNYGESLALRRELAEQPGAMPSALDDLAVALLNAARLPPGDPTLEAEALAIYQGLVTRFPQVKRYAEQLSSLQGDNPTSPPTDPTPAP